MKKSPKLASEKITAFDKLKNDLDIFLKNNPWSKLTEIEKSIKAGIYISNPWGDPSLAVKIDPHDRELLDALNNSIFPERFSAIYHQNQKAMEIIWTAVRLPKHLKEIVGRKFSFSFKNRNYDCEFSLCSQELLILSRHILPQTSSETNFRNMQSFMAHSKLPDEQKRLFSDPHPASFWIKDIEWNETNFLEIASHLNFHLSYFDDKSPTIIVHHPIDTSTSANKARYIRGKFPAKISSKQIDPNLLSFWTFAHNNSNPMIRFILYFRIIEYSSSHHADLEIRSQLNRLITAPDFDPSSRNYVNEIISIFTSHQNNKSEEIMRFKSIIRHCIEPKLLWDYIGDNIEFFSKEIKFEGGFSIKPLISKEEKLSTFEPKCIDTFCDAIRKIRNCLSHGKDQETSGVIRPTSKNFALLNPWVHLIASVAGEVILYRDN